MQAPSCALLLHELPGGDIVRAPLSEVIYQDTEHWNVLQSAAHTALKSIENRYVRVARLTILCGIYTNINVEHTEVLLAADACYIDEVRTLSWKDLRNTPFGLVRWSMLRGVRPPVKRHRRYLQRDSRLVASTCDTVSTKRLET